MKNIIKASILSRDKMLIDLYKSYFAPQITIDPLGEVLDFKENFIIIDLDTNHYQAMDLIWQFRRFDQPQSKLIMIDYFSPLSDSTINMLMLHYGVSNYFFKNHTTLNVIKQYMIDNT